MAKQLLSAAVAKLLNKYGPLSIVLSFLCYLPYSLIYLMYIKLIRFFKGELANSKCSNWLFDIRSSPPQVFLRSVTFQIYWNRTSAWVFSCKFTAYFQNNSSEGHIWRAASVKTPEHEYIFSKYSWNLIKNSILMIFWRVAWNYLNNCYAIVCIYICFLLKTKEIPQFQ